MHLVHEKPIFKWLANKLRNYSLNFLHAARTACTDRKSYPHASMHQISASIWLHVRSPVNACVYARPTIVRSAATIEKGFALRMTTARIAYVEIRRSNSCRACQIGSTQYAECHCMRGIRHQLMQCAPRVQNLTNNKFRELFWRSHLYSANFMGYPNIRHMLASRKLRQSQTRKFVCASKCVYIFDIYD